MENPLGDCWCKSFLQADCGVDLSQDMAGGQSGEVIKLFQVPRKIRFTFHFWRKSFVPDDAKLAELSHNSCERKNATFRGSNIHVFMGQDRATPRIYTPDTWCPSYHTTDSVKALKETERRVCVCVHIQTERQSLSLQSCTQWAWIKTTHCACV